MNYNNILPVLQAIRRTSEPASEVKTLVMAFTFCMIFILVGVALLKNWKKKKETCTHQITATVIENRPRRSSKNRVTYAPVYQYYYNGQEYTKVSTTSSRPPVFHVNDTVEFWIDPNNPETYFVPKDKTSLILGILFTVIGILAFVIAIIVL